MKFNRTTIYLNTQQAFFLLLFLCTGICASAQDISGTVADAETQKALPFATVKQNGSAAGIITDINGRFRIDGTKAIKTLTVSYIGYEVLTVAAGRSDTIFLFPIHNNINEVVITPPYDKIKHIVNTAIRNKATHNPDQYDWYKCHIYYKMKVDLLTDKMSDTVKAEKSLKNFMDNNHMLLSESYTQRYYRRPQQTQDIVLANRFSGLKKSYFTGMITDVLPFHIYSDFIKLNGVDYVHPVSAGWASRYEFDLLDELTDGGDTTYILQYRPKKNAVFNSLRGTVYINTNGYAISHIIAHSSDTSTNSRELKMEQIYKLVDNKWFPAELNYELRFKKFPDPQTGMLMSGHSIIDSVSFIEDKRLKFDKARTIIQDKDIDNRTPEEWTAIRFDPLTIKEQSTYHSIDSISKENHLEDILAVTGKAVTGLIPIGPVDFELSRLLAYNNYEGTRLGAGLYTNDKISRYLSVGGWFGYGLKDKVWKYGSGLTIFPTGEKDHWINLAYQKNYQNTGSINIHRELDRNGLRNFLLTRVDEIEEITATLHGRYGYWEIEAQGRRQLLFPRYNYVFYKQERQNTYLGNDEVSVNLRYAYGEKRAPVYGRYLPLETKYPIAYLRLTGGNITDGIYDMPYLKALASITYHTHINRWGKDNFRVDAGIVHLLSEQPLPRSFLMAGNGYNTEDAIQIYAWGGFMTLRPFTYFSDRFASLLYRHDFERSLYEHKYSKPYFSIAHNILWGTLNAANRSANTGIESPDNGYHESGIMLNRILRAEYLNIAFINLDAGVYHHWAAEPGTTKNTRFVLGLSANF